MLQSGIFKKNNDLWVEKYRPQNLSEYIGNSDIKEKFQNFINEGDIPHLLLSGPAGTGKSSFANIVVSHLNCDFKYINASNENSVDTVRTKITEFCTTSSFSPLKILVLDEADFITASGQAALRAVMEQYARNCRFILTCNEVERMIDAIQSRCQHFIIIPPSKQQVKTKMLFILKNEQIQYDDDELDTIINNCYPDVRKTIGALQKQIVGKVLKLDKEFFKLLSYQKNILSIIKTSSSGNLFEKVKEIRQLLSDSRVKTYTELYRFLYEKIEEYQKYESNIIPIILTLSEGLNNDALVVDKEINMAATLIKLLETINK